MQPGDLVRVNDYPLVAQLAGKIGVVVEETPLWSPCRRTYKVLVDGCIVHFYGVDLEIVDETR
jgi:hypothetical protein